MQIGLEQFLELSPTEFDGARFGLLMNRASVDARLQMSCDVVSARYPKQLTALFTPQHGFWGDAQANMVESAHDRHDGLDVPIYSLYSETRTPTAEMLAEIDILLIDLQDVGTRVYTFVWTLLACLKACARAGVSVYVLDRPNPLGGELVEGPLLQPEFRSFVGGAEIPMRHGLTIGELANLLNEEQQIGCSLTVIPMSGWLPHQLFPQWGRSWIPPSPNLPTFESALVYPGQVLLEGTNLSEGRGTTIPFQVIGAPFLKAETFCDLATELRLPGVTLLPIKFRPSFDKWSGELCEGVSIHVTDPARFRPYASTANLLQILSQRWPDCFRWLDPPYEYDATNSPIDIISGSDGLRTGLNDGDIDRLTTLDVEAWKRRVRSALLYPRTA